MKRQVWFIAALMLSCCLSLQAGVKNAKTLCVELQTGEVIEYALGEKPKIVFGSSYMMVKASTSKMLKFKDIRKAYFSDEASAIGGVEADGEAVQATGNVITLRQAAPGSVVRVYTLAGMLVKQAKVEADGTLQLAISDLPRGTYIIKTPTTAFKLYKN